MRGLFHPLLFILARATRQEMARQLQYLKIENEILRSKLPKQVPVTQNGWGRQLSFWKEAAHDRQSQRESYRSDRSQ